MISPLNQFFDALTEQEKKFLPALASDKLGILLRAAINELDWYSYNLARVANPTDEQQEQFYLLHIGVSRLIKLALEARASFDAPTVTYRREARITIPVLEIAAGLGMIEHGRRVAQTTMSGLGTIEILGEREFLVTLPTILPDDEYYERSIADHYRRISNDDFSKVLNSEPGLDLAVEVDQLLTELVYPFKQHFIGYGAHPTLDAYFFGIASHRMQLADGYDSFHYAIKFGGVTFQKYKLALTFFLSITLRHERFAEALILKDDSVRLENILTISSEVAGFIDSMCEAINYFGGVFEGFEETTPDEVRKIFSILSVGRENTGILDRPGCALPPMVRCSDSDFIRCQTAAQAAPMQFLLDSLRYHFPREYDQHQRTRERAMQLATKRVLNEAISGLHYAENIKVKVDRKILTDIDLVITESTTGILFLVQLKHQDLYGMDVHSRNIRTNRLKRQVEGWLSATKLWSDRVGVSEVRQTLRLPRDFPDPKVYRVILTRHYSYPIRDISLDEGVVFANWIQFFNAVSLVKQEFASPSLGDLVGVLMKGIEAAEMQEHFPEPRSEWIIDDLKFTTQQAPDR